MNRAEPHRPGVGARGRRRFSLRLRVILAILFVALAPQLLVFAWSQADRSVPGRMWGTTRDVVQEASRVMGAPGDPRAELARLAAERHVRLRVFDGAGESMFEADADRPDDNFRRLEALVLGDGDAPTLHDLDGTLGPVLARPEVQEAERNGVYVGCAYAPLVFCQGIRVARDHEMLVPLAIALALYTGSRIVRPIEHLRRQALERATTEAPGAMLHPEQADEIGGLADSFNALLDALETKRRANESFVADLVHELKNPVAAIRATAEALEGTALGPERAERLSRVLRSSALKLDDLITQFLELARAEAGMPDEERTDVDVLALTRGLVATMKDDPRHATVAFSFFPADDANAVVREGDAHAVVRGVSHRLEAP